MDFSELENFIKSKIPDADILITDMTGTRDHLDINITSSVFKGKMLIEQHRLVMDILKEKLKNEIHAVKIKTAVK
jgi:stress-induced morphogen